MNEKNKNLKSFSEYTPEERRKLGSRGGKKSAEKKREHRKFRLILTDILKTNIKTPKNIKKYADEYIKEHPEYSGISMEEAILLSVTRNAIERGDVESARFIRDTIGEKPIDESKVQQDGKINVKIKVVENLDEH